ncbi:MAG: hypothetical protein KBT68_08620, partial [bacterium]|nr:hypothetical protein [Candidatus Colisoma equi]
MSLSRFACRCGLLIAALLSVVDPLCARVSATMPIGHPTRRSRNSDRGPPVRNPCPMGPGSVSTGR